MDYTEKAKEFFKNDIYATETSGIVIEESRENYARCSMKIERIHLNAANYVMGGAIFTLADFTFAVAANMGNDLTVSLSSQIDYLNPTKGPVLYCEAQSIKNGKTICFFKLKVFDDEGLVATISTSGFRKSK